MMSVDDYLEKEIDEKGKYLLSFSVDEQCLEIIIYDFTL